MPQFKSNKNLFIAEQYQSNQYRYYLWYGCKLIGLMKRSHTDGDKTVTLEFDIVDRMPKSHLADLHSLINKLKSL